jgi:peptide deformylase
MEIITLGNELLKQKAVKVEEFDSEIGDLSRQMLEMLIVNKGIGLAAPQIGVLKRLFVVHASEDTNLVFVNPSIIETSHKTHKFEEGCLSIPGIYANVIRSEKIKVQAWNSKGRPFTLEADGLLARVILHEYDHLDGIVFLDRIPESKRKKLIEKFEKTFGKGLT